MNCECNNNSNRVKPGIKHVYGNVLRMAIPLTLRTLVKDGDEMIVNDTDFIPSSDHPVWVVFSKGKRNYPIIATMDGNVAIVEDKGKIPVGTYDISVECYDDLGNPYRFKQNAVLYVADTTAEAGIDEEIEYEAQTWYLNAAVFLATTEIGEIGDVIDAKLDDVFGNVVYDANAKEIRFYNKGNSRVLATIDSRPFIVDGTVADVYIDVSRQVLVVVLNEDAGGRRFSVPLYLVFNSYYKKDEVDSLVSRKVEDVRLDFSQELPLVVHVTKNGSSISSTIDFGSIDNAIHEDGRLVVACVNNGKFYQLLSANGDEVVFSRVTALDGYQELLIVNESNVWSMEDVDLGTGGGGGGYEPPAGGIPKSDLAQSVQDSLELADSSLQPSDKTQLQNAINSLQSALDTLIGSGNVQGAIDTFNEVKAFLDGIDMSDPAYESLAATLTRLNNLINTKANDADVVKSVSVNGTAQTKDSSGNVNVSVPTLTFDDMPTAGSNNPVKSGGVKQAIDNKLTEVVVNEMSGAADIITIDDADLAFIDEDGNIAMKVAEGHVETQNFDSRQVATNSAAISQLQSQIGQASQPVQTDVLVKQDDDAAFDISDVNGNVIMRINNKGHISTKGFDSENMDIFRATKLDSPQCVCHGYDSVSSVQADTIAYFRAGYTAGYRFFECDAINCSDGVPVCTHDNVNGLTVYDKTTHEATTVSIASVSGTRTIQMTSTELVEGYTWDSAGNVPIALLSDVIWQVCYFYRCPLHIDGQGLNKASRYAASQYAETLGVGQYVFHELQSGAYTDWNIPCNAIVAAGTVASMVEKANAYKKADNNIIFYLSSSTAVSSVKAYASAAHAVGCYLMSWTFTSAATAREWFANGADFIITSNSITNNKI